MTALLNRRGGTHVQRHHISNLPYALNIKRTKSLKTNQRQARETHLRWKETVKLFAKGTEQLQVVLHGLLHPAAIFTPLMSALVL